MNDWLLGLLTSLFVVVAALLAAVTGSPVVARLLRRFTVAGASGDDAPELITHPVGLDRGGQWIGYLERAAIAGGLVTGFPEVVAVVLALKGLGRYPELRADHGAGSRDDDTAIVLQPDDERRVPPRVVAAGLTAERFIIGTLASYLWAASWGLLGRAVLAAIS
ncbi:hypothetical protein ACPYO6_06340 [Georgenia sp. Z1344]|uniref:hypothetical protein n=1 Tax=Georgenia sp. Z1344 TaxID=3416706 RepID=UPI003CE7CB20